MRAIFFIAQSACLVWVRGLFYRIYLDPCFQSDESTTATTGLRCVGACKASLLCRSGYMGGHSVQPWATIASHFTQRICPFLEEEDTL